MFISLEGIDGSGKTTLANEIVNQCKKRNINALFLSKKSVLHSDDVYDERYTKLVDLIWGNVNVSSKMITSYHRFLTICSLYTLLSKNIERMIQDNKYDLIVVDGWFYRHLLKTSLRTNQSISFLASILYEVVEPDISLFLDISPEICWERRSDWKDYEVGYWDGLSGDKRTSFITYQTRVTESFKRLEKFQNWRLLEPYELNELPSLVNTFLEEVFEEVQI